MKYLRACFLWLGFLSLGYATPNQKSPSIKFFVSASLGTAAETDEIYRSSIGTGEIGVRTRQFVFSLSALSINQKTKSQTLQPGTLNLIPIMATIKMRFPMTKLTKANLGAGFGYVFASHDLADYITKDMNFYGYGIHDELNNGFEKHVMGGFEHIINQNFSFNFGVWYMFFNTKARTILVDKTSIVDNNKSVYERKLNLDQLFGLFALTYTF